MAPDPHAGRVVVRPVIGSTRNAQSVSPIGAEREPVAPFTDEMARLIAYRCPPAAQPGLAGYRCFARRPRPCDRLDAPLRLAIGSAAALLARTQDKEN